MAGSGRIFSRRNPARGRFFKPHPERSSLIPKRLFFFFENSLGRAHHGSFLRRATNVCNARLLLRYLVRFKSSIPSDTIFLISFPIAFDYLVAICLFCLLAILLVYVTKRNGEINMSLFSLNVGQGSNICPYALCYSDS